MGEDVSTVLRWNKCRIRHCTQFSVSYLFFFKIRALLCEQKHFVLIMLGPIRSERSRLQPPSDFTYPDFVFLY